jgi:hypothetical protein
MMAIGGPGPRAGEEVSACHEFDAGMNVRELGISCALLAAVPNDMIVDDIRQAQQRQDKAYVLTLLNPQRDPQRFFQKTRLRDS